MTESGCGECGVHDWECSTREVPGGRWAGQAGQVERAALVGVPRVAQWALFAVWAWAVAAPQASLPPRAAAHFVHLEMPWSVSCAAQALQIPLWALQPSETFAASSLAHSDPWVSVLALASYERCQLLSIWALWLWWMQGWAS